ncbi:MAG: methyltransferase domain-containing protein [Vicinamibacteria bacterium]|nr:methyltransferase domain-containing protein [Vicinamibacteria bacterium]
MEFDSSDIKALRAKLEEAERQYSERLARIDALSSFPLPAESLPDQPELVRRLNVLWDAPAPAPPRPLWRPLWRRVMDWMRPRLNRQRDFNSFLVQIMNGQLVETARLHAHLRDLASSLVLYLQRVLPLVDARDRMASSQATMRSELILEAFDRRLESLGRRIEGLLALRDRIETVGAEFAAWRATLASSGSLNPPAADPAIVVGEALQNAFAGRFRGSREEIRERLASHVDLFLDAAPVIDLGCGRGEFLELLGEKGVTARGVESNGSLAREGRARGLDVAEGDLLAFLKGLNDAGAGGVFAAQVAEHLPPRVLLEVLSEARRVLRPGGLLLLETVNPCSVIGFLDVFTRDLSHERPLHPDTLRFLAAAQGFNDVRIDYRAAVDPAVRLQPIPTDGLPPYAAQLMNENVERLNGLLYAPREYALIARR